MIPNFRCDTRELRARLDEAGNAWFLPSPAAARLAWDAAEEIVRLNRRIAELRALLPDGGRMFCCYCGRPISGTVMGAGDGTGSGRDGRWAHPECSREMGS